MIILDILIAIANSAIIFLALLLCLSLARILTKEENNDKSIDVMRSDLRTSGVIAIIYLVGQIILEVVNHLTHKL